MPSCNLSLILSCKIEQSALKIHQLFEIKTSNILDKNITSITIAKTSITKKKPINK
jgi:hypothetical protein